MPAVLLDLSLCGTRCKSVLAAYPDLHRFPNPLLYEKVISMNKVALLLPNRELCDAAASLISQYDLQVVCIEAVDDEEAASRAIALEEAGIEILICRGVQALRIRQAVHIAVVEIKITTQELGILLVALKKQLGIAKPKIGFVALENTLRDVSHVSDIFDVDMQVYLVNDLADFPAAFEHALADGVQAVIGGRTVYRLAKEANIPVGFMLSGTEGIVNALAEAQNISYALTIEKKNTAQMRTLLDYAFEGIMQISDQGIVQRANSTMERLLGKKEGSLVGHHIHSAVPKLNPGAIQAALQEGTETFGQIIEIDGAELMVNVAPVKSGETIDGAILAFHESGSVQRIGSRLRQEIYLRGLISRQEFGSVIQESRMMRSLISTARSIAKYEAPILITGENGAGKSLFARCIHNETSRRENGFVTVDCSGMDAASLNIWLFGNENTPEQPSMLELAQDGTLFLSNIDALPWELQYRLYLVTQGQYYRNGSTRSMNLNIRLIASTTSNLMVLVQQQKFRADLFYALCVLTLEIPALRLHREDIPGWVDFYLEMYRKKYTRYIHLSQTVYDLLRGYDWPGNLKQVNSVCERIVLLSPHRTVDVLFVKQLLDMLYPVIQPESNQVVIYKDKHAVEISELLKKYNGSREKVAQELGISKTTLWRKMKKYGIGSDFSV